MAKHLNSHQFDLPDGRTLVMIENTQTQSIQFSLRKGRKILCTSTISNSTTKKD